MLVRGVFIAMAGAPILLFGQVTHDLAKSFGKDFAAYEVTLGTKSERSQGYRSEDRIYRGSRKGCVVLTKELGAKIVTQVMVYFPIRHLSWQAALKRVGASTQGVRLVRQHGYFVLEGCARVPKGWMVWWDANVDATKQCEITFGIPHRVVY